jgi:glycosyltransferase involved in cell wall biosynthesis
MKILHINTYDTGGAAIAALRQHDALLEAGIDSNMLFAKLTDKSIKKAYQYKAPTKPFINRLIDRILYKLNIKVDYWTKVNKTLKNRVSGFESFSLPDSDFDITSQPIYKEADVINLHWVSGFLDYKFFLKNKKPIVWTLHDMNPFTGGCHSSFGCENYQLNCNNCFQLKGTVDLTLAEKNLKIKLKCLKNTKLHIVCISNWMLKKSLQSNLFQNIKHTRINHSINSDTYSIYNKNFARSVFKLEENKTIIITVTQRFNKGKGSDILNDVIEANTKSNIQICTLGNSIKNDKVVNLGVINDQLLLALAYAACDAVLIPSREDNAPNLIPEAFSCGKPIIGFEIGGITDHIIEWETGLSSKNITSKSLLDLIYIFHENKGKFNPNKIRDYALSNFNKKSQSNSYFQLYNSILKN